MWYSKTPPDGDSGGACVLEEHSTPESAEKSAGLVLEDGLDGWPEDVKSVEWGALVPIARSQEYDREETPDGEFDYLCKYRLAPVPMGDDRASIVRWLRLLASEFEGVEQAMATSFANQIERRHDLNS